MTTLNSNPALTIIPSACYKITEGELDLAGACRQGSVIISRDELAELFGEPNYSTNDPEEKVTFEYYLQTPFGVANLYDYWWNAVNTVSIGAKDEAVSGYLVNLFEGLGYKTDKDN